MREEEHAALKGDLKIILRTHGEFPNRRRHVFWRSALCLPFNKGAFACLSVYGIHESFRNMNKDYGFVSRSLRMNLIRLSSNLSHWMPLFPNIKHFPLALIRFLTVFKYCPVSSFEAVATILKNYCQHWFDDFPFSPKIISNFIENIVDRRDPELSKHLKCCGLSAANIGWMQLETFFTEALDEKSWYILWDHILVEEPKFLLMSSIAFLFICRNKLLNIKNKADFTNIQKPVKINVGMMVEITENLIKTEACDIFEPFIPIPKQPFYESFRFENEFNFVNVDEEELNLDYIRKSELHIVKTELKYNAHLCSNQVEGNILNENDDLGLRNEKLRLLQKSLKEF